MPDKIQIKCPKCGRILGDTTKSVDCVLNCPQCKAVHVNIEVVEPYKEFNFNEPE